MTQDIPDRQLFRPAEVAELMRVSVRTVYEYVRLGDIRSIRWKRRIHIRREEVLRILDGRPTP